MTENLGCGFLRLVKIGASGATWDGGSPVPSGFCGFDAGQDHLFQLLLPSGWKLASLNIKVPVTTEVEKSVYVAYTDELGIL